MSSLLKRMVRLYPRAWRERYGEEFGAILEERQASLSDVCDVALGALDAWLFPQVIQESSAALVVGRIRRSILLVLWAWVGVVVAGVGFQKLTEYEDFVRAARESAPVAWAFDAVVVGALVALAAVLAGGIPILFAAVRDALDNRRKNVLLLLCVPPLSLAIFVGYVLVLTRIVAPIFEDPTVHAPVNVALFLSIVVMFLLATVASAASVSAAVGRSVVGARIYRFALYPAALAALAMFVVSVATAVWGLALWARASALFAGNEGLLATPTFVTWLTVLGVMGGCACVAVTGAVCGLRAGSFVSRDAAQGGKARRCP
jgi:hypothetical protein